MKKLISAFFLVVLSASAVAAIMQRKALKTKALKISAFVHRFMHVLRSLQQVSA